MHAVKDNTEELKALSDPSNARGRAKAMIEPLVLALDDRFIIDDDKIERLIDYTVTFYAKNHKTMKMERMIRKISEYFHLKPKPKENGSDTLQGEQPGAGEGSATV